jgi:hypothetical protein
MVIILSPSAAIRPFRMAGGAPAMAAAPMMTITTMTTGTTGTGDRSSAGPS